MAVADYMAMHGTYYMGVQYWIAAPKQQKQTWLHIVDILGIFKAWLHRVV